MQNTMVLITFDENETYTIQNRVFSVLLGDAIPQNLVGTTDSHFYDHYSELSTVEANWGLYTLGRWDVGANVFAPVAAQTGDRLRTWYTQPDLDHRYFNYSYPGIFNSKTFAVQPVPDCHSNRNGRTTFPAIQKQWEKYQDYNYYHVSCSLSLSFSQRHCGLPKFGKRRTDLSSYDLTISYLEPKLT